MWSVVNNGGTGAGIRMAGFDIAGKTGTAQVVGLGKDIGKNKDHSWFVSYAPAYKPEIALVALIENSGFGGHHAAPAVRQRLRRLLSQDAPRRTAGRGTGRENSQAGK